MTLSFVLSACASAGLPSTAELTVPRGHVRLDFSTPDADGAELVRPVALDPKLPSVDRLATQLRFELGNTSSATLRLCIAPAGHVTAATITRSSTSPDFDAAVLRDIAGWRFAPTPGPATVQSCRNVDIVYQL